MDRFHAYEDKAFFFVHSIVLYSAGYRCGSPESWSEVKSLKVLDTSETSSPTFAVYGDLGVENSRSVPYIIKDVEDGRIDGVLHCGDLAYDLYEVRLLMTDIACLWEDLWLTGLILLHTIARWSLYRFNACC